MMQTSVSNYSSTISNKRLDSQFFSHINLRNKEKITNHHHEDLIQVAYVSDGNHLAIAESYSLVDGVRYLRGQDLDRNMMLVDSKPLLIPSEIYEKLSRSHIYDGDILLSIVGTIGLVGLVFRRFDPLVANCKLAIIRAKKSEIKAEYLYAFLTSKIGQRQLMQSIRGAVQTGIILPDLKTQKIVRLSEKLETKIAKLVLFGHEDFQLSKELYKNAESLLLSLLGLEDWRPKKQLSFVANYSDTIDAKRIDSDFFQPHYQELLDQISLQQVKLHNFGKVVNLKDKNFNPTADKQYKYIELSNINSEGQITGFTEALGQDLPTRARLLVNEGDVIISSIEGSLESVALISSSEDNALCSSGFHVANSKVYNPETLLVLMKSIIGQLQLKRGCNGTILTAISNDELNSIKLPEISGDVQIEIKETIQKMYHLKKQSKHLLEVAKRAVEIAIEKDEAAAFDFIERETA